MAEKMQGKTKAAVGAVIGGVVIETALIATNASAQYSWSPLAHLLGLALIAAGIYEMFN